MENKSSKQLLHDDLERIKTDGVNFLPLYGIATTAETGKF